MHRNLENGRERNKTRTLRDQPTGKSSLSVEEPTQSQAFHDDAKSSHGWWLGISEDLGRIPIWNGFRAPTECFLKQTTTIFPGTDFESPLFPST
jgi:hypothetical protein